ncbi:MAG TPA: hypothetical protein ENN32_07085 [Chloroflexi bacterium]|nr:hypothetical protein [Chloroflexota bacterium]
MSETSSSKVTDIAVLGLSISVERNLRRENINTIESLATVSEHDLLSIDGIGSGNLQKIKQRLTEYLSRAVPTRTRETAQRQKIRQKPKEHLLPNYVPVPSNPQKTDIAVLGLPPSVERRLRREKIDTVELLATADDRALLLIGGIGSGLLKEIKQKLAEYLAYHPLPDNLPIFIGALGFSVRIYNALRRSNIDTIEQLVAMDDDNLLSIRNFGETALAEVREKLALYLSRHPLPEKNQPVEQEEASLSIETYLKQFPKQHYLEELELPVRPYRALKRWGVHTIEHLALMTDAELLDVRNLGESSVKIVRVRLSQYLTKHSLSADFIELLMQYEALKTKSAFAFLPEQAPPTLVEECEPLSEAEILALVSAQHPIEHLGLSSRSYNMLKRVGTNTVEQLFLMNPEEILAVKNIGEMSLNEIIAALSQYLIHCPLPKAFVDAANQYKDSKTLQLSLLASNPVLSGDSNPTSPIGFELLGLASHSQSPQLKTTIASLLDQQVLQSASSLPLDEISINRLALPERMYTELSSYQIESIGALLEQPLEQFHFSTVELLQERLDYYINWLLKQQTSVLNCEIAGQGLGPVYLKIFEGTPLDAFINDWCVVLTRRERQVIYGRYGLESESLTLEQLGEQFNVTRERIRQIQKRAEKKLRHGKSLRKIEPLVVLLDYLLAEAHGLISEQEVDTAIQQHLVVGNLNPVRVAMLVFSVRDTVKHSSSLNGWGLKTLPLHLVKRIQKQFLSFLEQEKIPLSLTELMTRFKQTEFYHSYRSKLNDASLYRCLRICTEIQITEEICSLRKRGWERLGGIILALREIGESAHYETITERANALLPPELHREPHNIHAELGRHPDIFVRVGHGIFGLAEWGLENDGSLANAAYRVLTEAGKPLHADIIVDRVLKTWKVVPGSVAAALYTDDRFFNIGNNVYWIRDRELPETSLDFGDLFGTKLAQRQKEIEHWDNGIQYDTHDEVDLLRDIGTGFFDG